MVAQGNVGLAFGLVTAAGMATTIGAACVFFGNVCKPKVLAGALGFAAGVMLYVSFVEIFATKSIGAFVDYGHTVEEGTRYATFCFFGGIIIVSILDGLVHVITIFAIWLKKKELKKVPTVQSLKSLLSKRSTKSGGAIDSSSRPPISEQDVGPVDVEACVSKPDPANSSTAAIGGQQQEEQGELVVATNPIFGAANAAAGSTSLGAQADTVCADGACGAIDLEQQAAGNVDQQQHEEDHPSRRAKLAVKVEHAIHKVEETLRSQFPSIEPISEGIASSDEGAQGTGAPVPSGIPRDPDVAKILQEDHHQYALMKMGLLTALAIFIHNLPEGLATFVAALADASMGITIAIAIAIHNIPEGICVALPIYYATGSKWKGFFWGVMSGVSEPLGGLLGYLILFDTNQLVYAIVFAIVGGMMVCISLKELLPTALKYDPGTHVVVFSLFGGMAVMASSLLLFSL